MIKGVYKVYKNGELLLEKENQMTVAGRAIVLKALMGLIPSIGGNIQVGISSTANQNADSNGLIPDTRLGFSVSSVPVRLAFLDNSGNYDAMVFRGTIPSNEESYEIYELGIFPSKPNAEQTFQQLSLVSGSRADGWKKNGVNVGDPNTTLPTVPTNSCFVSSAPTGFAGGFRVGNEALFVKTGDTLNINKTFNQFTAAGENAFLADDYITVAYSKKSADTPAVTLKFLYNDDNYFYKTVTLPSGTTYGFVSILRSEFSIYGTSTLSWGNINGIAIGTASADVIIDAIRINDNDNLDTTYGMVSRTVLGSNNKITKSQGESLDIEYYLSFGFNKAI
ncbi:hypothetical protein UFOVP359_69 [uncultured Caudovirales phage]|jgi:hypothetical protein|uniref:Uncharacterized protein n=1 Tax=uncultured Caudovirales phage TaxID=2100421 RepID=A0A6J7WY54_9CAUD|nr:hypothetical protein UFOVP359_69 [uncultured Caudovirales phage]